jgi:hypothetical protein
MEPHDSHLEHAMRRSVASVRLLLALHELRVATTNQLARAAAIAPGRVKWIVHGRMPYYRPDQAPLFLGLVVVGGSRRRPRYAITDEGDQAAARLLRRRWRQG